MPSSKSIATLDEKKIDEIFAAIDSSNLPGAAVGIAIDGVPVYRKGFGLANMELPVALTPSMRMRIGSTTKHFTSLAYLLLCEEGLASIDDEIGKHIPELNETNRHATMRQLMGHTSGLRDVYSITMLFHGTGRRVTDKDLLAYYSTIEDVDFEPETRWSYNNGAYMLLGIAVERIAGAPLAEVLRERIFKPAGMYDTLLRPWDSDFVPNSATLHMIDPAGCYSRDYMGMEISGAGGIASSMDDMLRWLKHMDAPVVGSAETWRLLKQPHILKNGTSTGYGLGLITCDYRGVETLSHSGGVMGGNSQMIKVPAAKLDITVAVNRADLNSADLACLIIDACVDGLEPQPEASEESKAKARDGLYISQRDGRVIEFTAKDGMQLVGVDGMPGVPMSFDADGVLQLPPTQAFMMRHIVPTDKAIRVVDFGNEEVIPEVAGNPDAKLGSLVGTYANEALDVRLSISESAEGARLVATGRHGTEVYALEPITDLVWRAVTLGPVAMLRFVLFFEPDGSRASARVERMANMPFRRVD